MKKIILFICGLLIGYLVIKAWCFYDYLYLNPPKVVYKYEIPQFNNKEKRFIKDKGYKIFENMEYPGYYYISEIDTGEAIQIVAEHVEFLRRRTTSDKRFVSFSYYKINGLTFIYDKDNETFKTSDAEYWY